MKNALVLSGGGFKGAYQAAAIDLLYQNGLRFDYVSGISVGALNGAMVAQNRLEELNSLWEDVARNGNGGITRSGLASITIRGKVTLTARDMLRQFIQGKKGLDVAWKMLSDRGRKRLIDEARDNLLAVPALLDNSPLLDSLRRYVDLSRFAIPYQFEVVSLSTGKLHTLGPEDFFDKENLIKGIMASATMPVVWPSIPEIHTKTDTIRFAVDGGVRNNTPLKCAVEHIKKVGGSWTLWLIHCSSKEFDNPGTRGTLLGDASLSFDVLMTEVVENDIRDFHWHNERALLGHPNSAFIPLQEITPTRSTGGVLDCSKEIMTDRRLRGRHDALIALNEFTHNA